MRARAGSLILTIFLAVLCARPRAAAAHASQSSTYSKVEMTTSGRAIAVVFAFDTPAVLRQLQHDADAKVDRQNLGGYGDLFARYLFPRFTIANGGEPCVHPPALASFFWDAARDHVIAVTKFECSAPLDDLVFRSQVTRDMPLPHELVGDLRHGGALVRHFFTASDVEMRVALSSLAPGITDSSLGADGGVHVNPRVPDQERLYERLASSTLNLALPAEARAATDVHPLSTLAHFVREGILHIFTGYDHVAFIATLILAVATWRQLAVVVTSFTAAHSITLALATLNLVTLPARYVEPLIALSVLVVAVDALARPHAKARISMAFGFGLVHGLGLSNVLRDLGLSGRELLPALLGFNLGVEIGQLLIVAPLFVLVVKLRTRDLLFARSRNFLCAGVAVASTIWLVTRLHDAFFS
ncbi:MAG TPA: HupE/UreJ family protein [Polyangiaceae bacterium]|jgi:hydrogenase/urease accessory protein HupE